MTKQTTPVVKKMRGEKPEMPYKDIVPVIRNSLSNLTDKFYTIQIVTALRMKDTYANRHAVNSALTTLRHLGIMNVGGVNQNYHWHVSVPPATQQYTIVRLLPGHLWHQKNFGGCPH
ncbi:MAG: hypothetical protein WCO30_02535 [bacterium]